MDKVDQIHASKMMQNSLNNNADGDVSGTNVKDKFKCYYNPVSTKGNCREFVSNVAVRKRM